MASITYCKDCNKIITSNSKYCQKCYLLKHNPAHNLKSVLKMAHHKEKHYLWIGGKPKCQDCGKQLARYDAKRCRKCAKQGKLHSNYIDGRTGRPYPTEFNNKLKDEIRERDNYTCQGENCGMTEEEHIIVYGRCLEVHHIDYNKQNCVKTNLITTCKQCNIRANKNRDYWEEYYTKKLLNLGV